MLNSWNINLKKPPETLRDNLPGYRPLLSATMKRRRDEEDEDYAPAIEQSLRASRSSKKEFICSHAGCDKAYTKPAKLADHERTHTGERPFSCQEEGCDKAFFRKGHLQAHARSHLAPEDRPHLCPVDGCDKRFSTSQHLRQHAELHERPSPYVCDRCGESFHKQFQLRRHVGEVHLKTKPWPCPVTGCTMSFHYESIMIKHVGRVHDADKRYVCCDGDCNQVFTKWSHLQTHVKQTHKLECRHCRKQFTDRQAWRLHTETHDLPLEERKRFACTVRGCTKRFTKAHARSKHISVAHNKDLDYMCDVCDASFAHNKTLVAHKEREHSGKPAVVRVPRNPKQQLTALERLTGLNYGVNRPIACPHEFCRFRFSRNYDLERHLASQHAAVAVPQRTDLVA